MRAVRLPAVWTALLVFGLAGGCDASGCQGRGGSVPIPSGFPTAERVDRAGQARITSHGLDALGGVFSGVVGPFADIKYPVNPQSATVPPGIAFTFCGGNDCFIRYEVLDSVLTASESATSEIQIAVRLRRRSMVGDAHTAWPITSGVGNCALTLDQTITMPVVVAMEQSTTAIRAGFTTLSFEDVVSIPPIDVDATCTGLLANASNIIASLISGWIDTNLRAAIITVVNTIVNASTCQPSTLGCPTGSFALNDGLCHEGEMLDSLCVRRLSGEDLRGDLGAALLGVAPSGAFGEYMLAAVGNGQRANQGMSFNLAGGLRSIDEAFAPTGDVALGQGRPHICVPPAVRPPAPVIPVLSALQGNELPGTSIPYDIGIGLSSEWMSYVAFELYESGALCIAASGAQDPTISSALMPSLASTMRELAFPDENPALRISMRPQVPPRVDADNDINGNAVILAGMDTVFVDVEIFVQERYTRLLTYVVHPRLELAPRIDGSSIAFDVSRLTLIAPSSIGNLHAAVVDEPGLVDELDAHALEMFAAIFQSISGFALPTVPGTITNVVPDGIQTIEQAGQSFFVTFCELAPAP